tara:strand:+ start:1322 stop:1768 length:447 start_codon:yes stop_codon:yes gene_type:complete
MKFTKKIQGYNLKFEMINSENDSDVVVEVTIPPYGHYSRGQMYTIGEFHEAIVEASKTKLTPTFSPSTLDAPAIAKRDEARKITLKYSKKTKTRTKKTTKAASSTVTEVITTPVTTEVPPKTVTAPKPKRTYKPRASSKKTSSQKTSK